MADFSKYTRIPESETTKAQAPDEHLRSQPEKERNPSYFQRQQEKERTDSSWAGSSMGGGTWAGRSR